MGKSSGSKPTAPNPFALADQQATINRNAAKFNLNSSRVNNVNPYGTTTWSKTPQFDQAGFDAALANYKPGALTASGGGGGGGSGGLGSLAGGAAGAFFTGGSPWGAMAGSALGGALLGGDGGGSGPTYTQGAPNPQDYTSDQWTDTAKLNDQSQSIFDTSGAGIQDILKNIPTDGNAYSQAMADAIYQKSRLYTDPADKIARDQQQSDLADRGFSIGDEAMNKERTRLDDAQTRGRTDASLQATLAGGAEGRANIQSQTQLAQALQQMRQAQMNGVTGMPSSVGGGDMNPVDLTGAVNGNYTNALDAYNASRSSSNQLLGGGLQALAAYYGRNGGSTSTPAIG